MDGSKTRNPVTVTFLATGRCVFINEKSKQYNTIEIRQTKKTISRFDPPSGVDLQQHVHHIFEWQLIEIQIPVIIATVQVATYPN